jgi:hypothetical protein
MPDDARNWTCEEFQNLLAALLESGADIANHPHGQMCEGCCGFVAYLYRIAEHSRYLPSGTDEFGSDDWSEST